MNAQWQKKEEEKAMAQMAVIASAYEDPEDAEYNKAMAAAMNKAFAMVKAEVNGNWYNYKGQDQLIAAVEKVFKLIENCESYEAVIELCRV